MGRRTDHTRAEIKEMALSAARQIIQEKGLDAITARSIATQIGYSPGTLYNLFENVDEIVLRLNQETLVDLAQTAEAALNNVEDPEQRLLALGRAYVAFAEEQGMRWRAIFDDRPSSNGRAKPNWYEKSIEHALGIVQRELLSYFSDQEPAMAQASARVLWAGVHGISVLAVTGRLQGDQVSPKKMVEMLISNYVRGASVKTH